MAEPTPLHHNQIGVANQDHSRRHDAAPGRTSSKGPRHGHSDLRMRLVRNTGNDRVIDLVRPLLSSGQELGVVSAA
ncbi:MAG: hypothetical protein ACK56I_06355, partial [bacterium]